MPHFLTNGTITEPYKNKTQKEHVASQARASFNGFIHRASRDRILVVPKITCFTVMFHGANQGGVLGKVGM